MTLTKLSVSLLSCGLFIPFSYADTSTSKPATTQKDLATIVVTASASASGQDIKTAPASISVITAADLEGKPYYNLVDAIRGVEGVSMVGDSTNNKDISIRGLPGDYTLILIDGKRQGTRETMNYGTQGVQHHLIPPLNAIERIEIVRGPMSSLYGSDAMGGVINILTKKDPQEWSGSLNLNTTIPENSKFGDNKLAEFWLGGPISDRISMQVYGKYSDRDEDNYPEFGAFAFENQSATAKLNAKLTDAQDIQIEVGKDEVNYEGSADKTYYYVDKHDRTHWALTHNGDWTWGTSKLSLHQEKEEYDNKTEWSMAPTREITNTVVDALTTIPFESNQLNIGAQFIRASLTGLAKESAVPGYINSNKASYDSTSLFAENETQLNDRLSLTQGLRLDNHSLYDDHISPRLYAVYLLNDEVTLRGGVATGFKAPTLRQSTTDYCMITGSNTGLGTLCGNANLKPETSTSYEIGARFESATLDSFYLNSTLFYNDFKNKVVSYDTGVVDPYNAGSTIYTWDNISKVKIYGLELGSGYDFTEQWSGKLNYTYLKSERQGGEPSLDGSSLDGKPLDRTPENQLSLQLDGKLNDALSVYGSAIYTGKQYWAGFRNGATNVRERKASVTADLGGSYKINQYVSVNLAALNIFDKTVALDTRARTSDMGNWMLDEGRRYSLGLSFSY